MKNNRTKKNNKNSVYSINDYRSNDGMLTTVWGPGMWHYLHTMSFNYPVSPSKEDKKHYFDFIISLQYVLPCGKCRKNLKKNFKKLPLTMSNMESRETFSRYVYDLHEVINTMLKKNSGLSYEDVRERYEHFRARCAKSYRKLTNESIKLIKRKTAKKEKGCTVPLYGEKSKCILKIVPHDTKCETLQIDNKCIKRQIEI